MFWQECDAMNGRLRDIRKIVALNKSRSVDFKQRCRKSCYRIALRMLSDEVSFRVSELCQRFLARKFKFLVINVFQDDNDYLSRIDADFCVDEHLLYAS